MSKWIKTSDHQPTSFDTDKMGRVLVWNEISGFSHLLHVDHIHTEPLAYTHWQPLPAAPNE
ncbi:MAG: DUF551 domain-containing protein [Pseudomonas sp.]|nr:DUF551 domain-containing protein [Pseudomonas sp.]